MKGFFHGCLLVLLATAPLAVRAEPDDSLLARLPHAQQPERNRIVSGALSAEQIEGLREAGITHVINLRTAAEMADFDERAAVEAQGLSYHHLPIKGVESLTRENAGQLDELLSRIGAEGAVIHCSSGNRVGALVAVREAWINGRSPDEAIAIGKRWGLTKLEQPVRELLSGGK